MKITLLTVGKTDKGWVKDGLDIYASRLKHYIPFSIIEIPELKNVSALSKDQIKTREGELILKNVRPADDLILLDERGKEHSSVEFAKVIQDKISYAGKDIVSVTHDLFPPDGTCNLRRTALPRFHNNERRAIPPRMK